LSITLKMILIHITNLHTCSLSSVQYVEWLSSLSFLVVANLLLELSIKYVQKRSKKEFGSSFATSLK
jgi:hypothetical protein